MTVAENRSTNSQWVIQEDSTYKVEIETASHRSLIPKARKVCVYQTRSSASNLSLNFSFGSHLEYKVVTETLGNGSNNIGKSIYYYTNSSQPGKNDEIDTRIIGQHSKINISNSQYPFPPATSKAYKRGLLEKKEVFDTSGNLKQLEEYEYTFSGIRKQVPGILSKYLINIPQSEAEGYHTNGAGNIFGVGYYTFDSEWVFMSKKRTTIYGNQTGNPLVTETDFEYDNDEHLMLTRTVSNLSNGKIRVEKKKYPGDYDPMTAVGTSGSSLSMGDLVQKHIIASPVETQVWEGNSLNDLKLINRAVMEYTDLNNGASNDLAVKPSKLHVFKSTNPVSEAQLNEATTGNPARYTDLIPNSNYFEHEFSYEYDQASGNLVQTEKVDDLPDAYIWDQGQTRPVAKVINAEASQIAYTSFEDVLDQGTQYDGNWEINNIPGGGWSNATGNQFRGDKSFNLSPYAGGRTITKRNLPAGEYTISFWYKNANIDIQGISQPSSTSGANSTWKRYEAIVTIAAGQNITLSSSGNSRIDELRLYPKGAFMTSYVYTDRGQIRSVSDANDVSNTMEYDDFGRLTIIRDQDGNIVEKTDYHYKNQ